MLNKTIHETWRSLISDPYLLAILLVGSCFRLYALGAQSIWLDEAYSITLAKLKLYQIYFLHENTPPLYYAILHYWIHLFGASEISVRLP